MKSKISCVLIFISIYSCQSDVNENKAGVVSSATPEATEAGIAILENGGNAIDAAIAVAFSLAVTEPAMTGLGAGIQELVSPPGEKPFMINGTTYAPAATPPSATREDIIYHKRSTIPSFVKTLDFAFQKYGSGKIGWADALKPSISYARNGFKLGPFRTKVYQRYEKELLESPYFMGHFLVKNNIPSLGQVLKQPKLASTLERLASAGGDDFYNGEIAASIAKEMHEHNGWITIEDLNRFPEPSIVPALHTYYKGYSVFTSTPPCGGWVVLLALNILENLSLNSPQEEKDQNILAALALAHGERQKYPVRKMIDFENEIIDKISKEKAATLIHSELSIKPKIELEESGETTHFSIIDKNGMAVSVTTSINAYFGSRASSKELGFIYNSYMEDFIYGDSTHSFAVGPGKMAYSSMSPTIVQDAQGKNVMAIGSPGSARIISSVTQVIQSWIDLEQDINKAVSQPRVHVNGNNVYFEETPSNNMQEWIKAKGYEQPLIKTDLTMNNRNAYYGGIHAVAFENGKWVGAADQRRDGTVAYTKSEKKY